MIFRTGMSTPLFRRTCCTFGGCCTGIWTASSCGGFYRWLPNIRWIWTQDQYPCLEVPARAELMTSNISEMIERFSKSSIIPFITCSKMDLPEIPVKLFNTLYLLAASSRILPVSFYPESFETVLPNSKGLPISIHFSDPRWDLVGKTPSRRDLCGKHIIDRLHTQLHVRAETDGKW